MLEYLIDDKFVSKDDRIAVGVSGGADSMLLLWALFFKQKQTGYFMKVIHVNHNLRGKESDSDSEFVREFCEKKKIPCEIVSVNVKFHKTESKKTLEESARELRYDAIRKVMKKDNLNKLFLAHHKNDQVETILMHIFRGSGILGACGMRQNANIIRPLLNLEKQEILKLAKDYGIEFVKDSSNDDNSYTRNYLRNVILPEIEKAYPGAVQSIFAFGQKCEEIQDFIEANINSNLINIQKDEVLIKGQILELPSFERREYLRQAFLNLGIFSDIEAKHYDLVTNLFEAEVNSCLDLPHKVQAKRTYQGVKIFKQKTQKNLEFEHEFALGETKISETALVNVSLINSESVEYGDGSLYVDFDKIPLHALWRNRKLGDKISKLGTGSKKLNDYFTDKKIDVEVRDKIPLLASQSEILVVSNLDISEKVKIDSDTQRIAKITFKFLSSLDNKS